MSLAVHRPDGQGVAPRRQPPEPVLRIRRSCAAYQPVTAIFRRHVQAQRKRGALNDSRCVPARQYLILSLLRQNFCGQMLYRRGNSAVNRSGLRVERCPVVHDGLFFRHMLYGGDGIRSVVIFPDSHTPEETLAQRRQFQPPDAVFRHAVRYPADLNLHTVGNRLHVHADRQAFAIHQAYQRGAGRRQGNLPVKGQNAAGAVNGQNPPAQADAGIILVANLNHITGNVAQPLRPHTKIYRLGFQQLRFYQPQPGAVRLPATGTAKRIHFYQIASVVTDGDRVFHQFRGRLPAIIRVSPVHLCRIMAVLPRTEAVTERCTLIRHHHIAAGIGPDCIRGPVLHEGQPLPVPHRHTTHGGAEVGQHIPRLTLLCQIRIKGHTRLCPAESVRDHLVAVLAYCIQRPPVHVRRADSLSHAITGMCQHIP